MTTLSGPMTKPGDSPVAHATAPVPSAEPWQVRVDLAALYRLFVHYGWTDLTYTHISTRVPGRSDRYLINPYGLLFGEIAASTLVEADFAGTVMNGAFPYNMAGHVIHTTVLRARSPRAAAGRDCEGRGVGRAARGAVGRQAVGCVDADAGPRRSLVQELTPVRAWPRTSWQSFRDLRDWLRWPPRRNGVRICRSRVDGR
ncbi:MAG: class II aldolase/adducin family protein [Vicinamibacterales bacterium]